jgi:hypothetical protein
MLHFLTAGHLDESAARQAQLRVLAPLDERILQRLLDEFRDQDSPEFTFEQKPVLLKEGCVRCPWYMPRTNFTSIRFVLALHTATECVIADIEHGRIVAPAELSKLLAVRDPERRQAES